MAELAVLLIVLDDEYEFPSHLASLFSLSRPFREFPTTKNTKGTKVYRTNLRTPFVNLVTLKLISRPTLMPASFI